MSRTAFGWVRPYARGVPERWPLDFGWMNAYPVEGYDVEKPREAIDKTSLDIVNC